MSWSFECEKTTFRYSPTFVTFYNSLFWCTCWIPDELAFSALVKDSQHFPDSLLTIPRERVRTCCIHFCVSHTAWENSRKYFSKAKLKTLSHTSHQTLWIAFFKQFYSDSGRTFNQIPARHQRHKDFFIFISCGQRFFSFFLDTKQRAVMDRKGHASPVFSPDGQPAAQSCGAGWTGLSLRADHASN